ncbi:TetR family transcriptional regulator [Streptomyces sp. NBC_00059]|uniref:TetR/AcrR family transcriptional regulator n=1 Tax=Streptomyces sp. NBC_00059 TaxID=2975635 RepID=UPI0022507901|nr:TetR family transcriptional regulator [Streptomyces sp. NBC_00059]MCX5414588.1 TetR family transcriptional regulator [Streptomyces sp. NBC_00059]
MDPESKTKSGRRPSGGSARAEVPEAAAQRRPGSHDPEGNRRAVLDAARRLFGAHGYKGVGVRAIAADAGVTPGLVMAYFGTKDGLFREAVGDGAGVSGDLLAAAAGEPGDLPGALARAYLDRWDRLPADDPWPALIRSAVSHPPSAELLRTILDRQVGEPLAQVLGTSAEADVRTSVVRSVLFGVIMERYLFAHEPAASVPTEEFAQALTDVLATAFGGSPGGRGTGTSAPGVADPDREPRPGHVAPGPAGTPPGPPAEKVPGVPTRSPGAPSPSPGASSESPGPLFALLDDCAARHQLAVGRAVRAYGISLPAYDVLAALREAGAPHRLTMGEVAAAGAVRAGGLTQQADRLAEAGLIRRERDSADRRIVRLCLTAEGLELTGRVAAVREAQERELLAGMGPGERRRLTALLGTLGQTLGAGGPEQ